MCLLQRRRHAKAPSNRSHSGSVDVPHYMRLEMHPGVSRRWYWLSFLPQFFFGFYAQQSDLSVVLTTSARLLPICQESRWSRCGPAGSRYYRASSPIGERSVRVGPCPATALPAQPPKPRPLIPTTRLTPDVLLNLLAHQKKKEAEPLQAWQTYLDRRFCHSRQVSSHH